MPALTQKQTATASWLLRRSAGKPEDFIRKRIGELLGSLDIDYEISYPTAEGPADLYLPRRRTIIEAKAGGLAEDPEKAQPGRGGETPKQQLERYLRSEIAYEIRCRLENDSDRPWVGIVTDGRVWHAWKYAHGADVVASPVDQAFRPTTPESLIERLRYYVQGDLVGKPWIPADPQRQFEPRLEELRKLHAEWPQQAARSIETKRRLWLEMLRTTSMEPESEAARQRLFVAHSFLVAFARGVIQVLASPGQEPRAEEILKEGFVAWIVETARGRQWANRFFAEIAGYEWRRRPGDVLRPLYEAFVDERDRKAFGEFYTPDWLAELIVREVCDEEWCEQAVDRALVANRRGEDIEGVGVLDPTCGSGTFLYHAAKRILASPKARNLADSDRTAVVCSLVHGIDVHPVAAEIARATLLRVLPTSPPQGNASLRIHEGDALLIRSDDEDSLFRAVGDRIRIATPKGREVFLPRSFVGNPHFADNLRRLVLSVQDEEPLPGDILESVEEEDRPAMAECYRQFADIIGAEGNSVWTWYILNTTGPYRLAERKVDRIVANPPWVKMANVQVPARKRALEKFAGGKDMALWVGGKQAPHFDIAQLFIKRARQLYLESPDSDPAAWLVKKSALRAGSWERFRVWHRKLCKQTLDLESTQPFGGGDSRRCCVLFEVRASGLGPGRRRDLVARVEGGSPDPDASLEEVGERLSFRAAAPAIPRGVSGYVTEKGEPVFRQGASITPKVLTTLDRVEGGSSGKFRVVTARSQHLPWSALDPQSGEVPRKWVRSVVLSKDVLPYALSPAPLSRAMIPVGRDGGLLRMPGEASGFWALLDEIYRQYRGEGLSTPQTLLAQIDYGSKLSAQLNLAGSVRKMVVHPSAGDIMRACRLRPGEAIVDASLYRFVAESAAEAAYLVGLMNAESLTQAFGQSRTSGRNFHTLPWRAVPIPRFDKRNAAHVELSKLAARAEQTTQRWLSRPEVQSAGLGQVGLSKRIRERLRDSGISAEIDDVARRILPRQVRRVAG